MHHNKNANTEYRKDLKEKILTSASSLFYRHGIKSVKMDDIAKCLSISKRTMYEIYANKEDLLFEVIKHHNEENRNVLRQFDTPDANVMDILVALFRLRMKEVSSINPLFLEDMQKYPKLLEMLRKESEARTNLSYLFFERGVKEGYFLPNLNYQIIEKLTRILFTDIMEKSLYKQYGIQEFFRTVMLFFLRGICTMKGIKYLDRSFVIEDESYE